MTKKTALNENLIEIPKLENAYLCCLETSKLYLKGSKRYIKKPFSCKTHLKENGLVPC